MSFLKGKLTLYYSSLFCAIWFVLTSAFWPYYMNLIISFPIGILSFILHKKAMQNKEFATKYDVVIPLLILGVVVSVVALFLFM